MMHNANISSNTIAALCSFAIIASAYAQSDVVPAPKQSRPLAIVHAIVHTATLAQPVIEDGHVLFDGGRIVSVGAGVPELPSNCEIFDAKGNHTWSRGDALR